MDGGEALGQSDQLMARLTSVSENVYEEFVYIILHVLYGAVERQIILIQLLFSNHDIHLRIEVHFFSFALGKERTLVTCKSCEARIHKILHVTSVLLFPYANEQRTNKIYCKLVIFRHVPIFPHFHQCSWWRIYVLTNIDTTDYMKTTLSLWKKY